MAHFDLIKFVRKQKAFSERAFGPGARQIGTARHILQECDEVLKKPDDLSEWVDIMLLSLDIGWRSGYAMEQVSDLITFRCSGLIQCDLMRALNTGHYRVPTAPKDDAGENLTLTESVIYWVKRQAKDLESGGRVIPGTFDFMFVVACAGAKANGFSPEDIAVGLNEKLERNSNRKWPDWRTLTEDDAINHQKD
jgi:hypothetical protein